MGMLMYSFESIRTDCMLWAKDCSPEIDTSEIIVDVQWYFAMDFQRRFPMEFHLCDFWRAIVYIYIYICTCIYIYIYTIACLGLPGARLGLPQNSSSYS